MKHYKSTLIILVGLLLLSFGCTGQKGEPGMDGINVESIPPIISILDPLPLSLINADTLKIIARANDSSGIEKVVFYLDGSSQVGDTIAEVTETEETSNLYIYAFPLLEMNVPDGQHSIVARAYDLNGNTTSTPPIVVYTEHSPTVGRPYVLKHWTSDSLKSISYPRRRNSETVVLDSLFNVRFDAIRACQLDAISIYLDVIPGENTLYDRNLILKVARTSTGIYPIDDLDNPLFFLDTLLLIPDTLRTPDDTLDIELPGPFTPGWYTSFPDSIITFQAGDRFHVAFDFVAKESAFDTLAPGDTSATSDSTRIAIGVSVKDRYDFSSENLSGFMDVATERWLTLQEDLIPESQTESYEFQIEAWVTYTE
jgi:Bacterial Ig domain